MKGLLNNSKFPPVSHLTILLRAIESNEGGFKKPRPARPRIAWCIPKGATIIGRAERTGEYVSMTKGRERRWRTFLTLP